jgi:hypothetical protein
LAGTSRRASVPSLATTNSLRPSDEVITRGCTPTHKAYVREVARAADHLCRLRLLLDEDVQRHLEEAEASGIGK